MFSGKTQVPCVGISFGIDRIFSITQAFLKKKERRNEVDVFVMAFGGGKDFTGLLKERSQICARLWDADIKAELLYKVKPKLPNQFKAAETNGVPFALILGEVCTFLTACSASRCLIAVTRTNSPKAKLGSRRWVCLRTTR